VSPRYAWKDVNGEYLKMKNPLVFLRDLEKRKSPLRFQEIFFKF